jgi:flagellar basal-body rod protein FlgG
MNRALIAGAAGMAAQQAIIDSISVNLANADTPGYRSDRPEFAALVTPSGVVVGSVDDGQRKLFSQGKLEATNNADDLAIDGEGMFQVQTAAGRAAFTRAGNFTPDANGHLRLPNGAALADVLLPRGTTQVTIAGDGAVRCRVAGKSAEVIAGHVRLNAFADNTKLRFDSDGLFYPTQASGKCFRGTPGSGGFGTIKQRCLERSNVNVIGAMMEVLAAQRAYEASAKTVQAADELLRLGLCAGSSSSGTTRD